MPVRARRLAIAQLEKDSTAKPLSDRWTGDIVDLEGIGHGISGMVLIIDKLRVIKVSFGTVKSELDMNTERRAYGILTQAKKHSPHILNCFELDNPRGLILERCDDTVRHRLRSIPGSALLCDVDARKWAKQAAEGLAFLHNHKIIHADVGCHNMLLDSRDVLKLCDFAGSSVEGSRASTNYELWSRLPSKREGEPTRTSDLFALGSAIYEMSTKELPYQKKSLAVVRSLYEREQFPSVKSVASLGNVITKCWLQKYTSASEVVREIDPDLSICCGAQEDSMEEPMPSPDDASVSSPTVGASSQNLHIPLSKASRSSAKTSFSSSSTSSSSSFVSVSSSKSSNSSSLEKLSKSTVHSHDQEQPADHKAQHRRYSERPSGRKNKTFARRKTRYQSPLSHWITKSLQRYGSQPP